MEEIGQIMTVVGSCVVAFITTLISIQQKFKANKWFNNSHTNEEQINYNEIVTEELPKTILLSYSTGLANNETRKIYCLSIMALMFTSKGLVWSNHAEKVEKEYDKLINYYNEINKQETQLIKEVSKQMIKY